MLETIPESQALIEINECLINAELMLIKAKDKLNKLTGSNKLKFNKKIARLEGRISYYKKCRSLI